MTQQESWGSKFYAPMELELSQETTMRAKLAGWDVSQVDW